MTTSRHGAQNAHDAASKQTLDAEFGTSNEDECMTKILEMGDVQATEVRLPLAESRESTTLLKLTARDSEWRAPGPQER